MKRLATGMTLIVTSLLVGCTSSPDSPAKTTPAPILEISLYFDMPAVDHMDPWYSGYYAGSPHYKAHFSTGEWTTASAINWDSENQQIAVIPGDRPLLLCRMVEVNSHDSAADDSCAWTLAIFFDPQPRGMPEEIFVAVRTGCPPASHLKTTKVRQLRKFWKSAAASSFESGFDVSAAFDGSDGGNAQPCELRLVGRIGRNQ